MKIYKKILPIIISILFISLIFAPSYEASGPFNTNIIKIAYIGEDGKKYYANIVMSDEQIEIFKNTWNSWENEIKKIRRDNVVNDSELIQVEAITVDLLEEIKELTYDPGTGGYLFPPDIDLPTFIHDYIFHFGRGSRILSIGRGKTWLPFNRQGESFVGVRFSPIVVSNTIGFTRVMMRSYFPYTKIILDRFFQHRTMTLGFKGLFIDFGKRYFDTQAGPVIMVGSFIYTNIKGS